MNEAYHKVQEFHDAFGHPSAEQPTAMGLERATGRATWTAEEVVEFLYASASSEQAFDDAFDALEEGMEKARLKIKEKGMDGEAVVNQADALTDAMYFILGSFVEIGTTPNELLDIVHSANMAKLGPDGKPIYRAEDGKVQKPDGWEAPEPKLEAEIHRQQEEG